MPCQNEFNVSAVPNDSPLSFGGEKSHEQMIMGQHTNMASTNGLTQTAQPVQQSQPSQQQAIANKKGDPRSEYTDYALASIRDSLKPHKQPDSSEVGRKVGLPVF